jgi:hypothetical protein
VPLLGIFIPMMSKMANPTNLYLQWLPMATPVNEAFSYLIFVKLLSAFNCCILLYAQNQNIAQENIGINISYWFHKN